MEQSVKLYLDKTLGWVIRISWVMVVVGALAAGAAQVVGMDDSIWAGAFVTLMMGATLSLFVGLLYWVRGLLRSVWFPETK